MENIKYLSLIDNQLPWVGSHCSCLLDENFREKYTIGGKKRKDRRLIEAKENEEKENKAKLLQQSLIKKKQENSKVIFLNSLVMSNLKEDLYQEKKFSSLLKKISYQRKKSKQTLKFTRKNLIRSKNGESSSLDKSENLISSNENSEKFAKNSSLKENMSSIVERTSEQGSDDRYEK